MFTVCIYILFAFSVFQVHNLNSGIFQDVKYLYNTYILINVLGFAVQNFELRKSWTEAEVREEVYKIFNSKLGRHIQFDFCIPMGGHLIQPTTRNMDGENISKLFYNKIIYIRPTIPIISIEESDNTDETNNFYNKQGENSTDIDINFNIQNSSHLTSTVNAFELDCVEPEPQSVSDILTKLQSSISEENMTQFNIFREDVFNCCLRALHRKSFSPYHKISVLFTDCEDTSEGAIDAGGPQREMFRLVLNYLHNSHLFEGPEYQKYISLNKDAFVRDEYYEAGRLIAMSIVHCGCGPHFFSDFLFRSIVSNDIEPTIGDIKNEEIQQELKSISDAMDMQSLRNTLINSLYLKVAGWETITDFKNKEYLIKDVIHFYAIERNEKCLHRFIEGLKTLNLYDQIRKYPEYFIDIMCNSNMRLINVATFDTLFKINYSPDGHNNRRIESRIIAFWKDYLIECEENVSNNGCCTLEEILIFCTGANTVPLLGFTNQPTIQFLHGDSSRFPKGNTCSLELHLPTIHADYDKFKEDMTYGIKNGLVFGYF